MRRTILGSLGSVTSIASIASLTWVAFASAGCTTVLDAGGYHSVAELVADGGSHPLAQSDGAADACVPGSERRGLENACTGATCAAFATAVPSCDGNLCPLPPPPPAPDSGAPGSSSGADAGGIPLCSSLESDPNAIVYVTGSTALRGFIQEVSKVLATQPTNPTTIVYQASASCLGVQAILDPADNALAAAAGALTYYDASGTAHSCALDPSTPTIADVGASDVFYSTCYMNQALTPPLPQTVGENYGPVQVMNFVVPQGSSERSISLTAAYYVFGFGAASYPVAPWTDPTELQVRSGSSGTQSMIAAAIGVPAGQWVGSVNGSSSAVGSALIAAGQSATPSVVDSSLGILASDYLIQNLQTLRGLAVQDENVGCAYYPSLTATSRDLANVRDGHYPLWGPSHFYARVDSQNQLPLKPGVSQFIDGLSGIIPLPGLDLVTEYASKGLLPLCAMRVSRSSDGAEYQPFRPTETCNCYFDLVATGSTSCQACNTDLDCPTSAPNCNKYGAPPQQGYCDL
jgi:hypothetical protein